jgi:hypothetical protein
MPVFYMLYFSAMTKPGSGTGSVMRPHPFHLLHYLLLFWSKCASRYFQTFMELRNRFHGIDYASLAGQYNNPIPTRFLAPHRLFKNSSTRSEQVTCLAAGLLILQCCSIFSSASFLCSSSRCFLYSVQHEVTMSARVYNSVVDPVDP